MGLEAICSATWVGKTAEGKAQLETDHLLFRGDFRLKVPFADLNGVHAANGTLTLKFKGGPATLQLGDAAEKWASKILKPPSRLQKLGIKPGIKIALEGKFEAEFTGEVREQTSGLGSGDLVFWAVESAGDLEGLRGIVSQMSATASLWIVYPKGKPTVRETAVINSGRSAGLTDIKVVSFSTSHTALKFVRPKAARQAKPTPQAAREGA